MRINALTNRLVTIMAVLLLVLSFNLSINVSATFIDGTTGDGVWYDDFKDCDDMADAISQGRIESSSKSVLHNSTDAITLGLGKTNNTYDYADVKTKDNIEAWEHDLTLLHPDDDDLIGILSSFLNPSLLIGNEFTSTMYTGIAEAGDDKVAETESWWGSVMGKIYSPIHQFKFTIDEDESLVEKMEICWNYGDYQDDAYLDYISMYVWTYGALIQRWQLADTIDYDETKIGAKDFDLRFYDDAYISEDGEVDFLIIGKPLDRVGENKHAYLRTDFVNLTVQIGRGFYANGHVISTEIHPQSVGSFYGWESLMWEGTRPSSKSSVKIQVLDEDDNVIPELDGNKDGFTYSPIDLSSISASTYPKIKIKANFTSTGLDYTSSLYSWGVTWQTKEGFYDDFTYDFRIYETNGAENDGGNLIISEFYGDWPIFGKNPANTRSYYGLEASQGKNDTYWRSEDGRLVGGDFRSPVVSNGKVYIASEDNKIYAFNVTTEDVGKALAPADMISNAKYVIDSSLAVSGEYLIFGTSKLSSTENKVYALNSSNLSEVKWTYYVDNDDYICYSSAPTIANGRVFITSWSGTLFNNPLMAQIYMKIKSLLGVSIWKNNKLTVLDINSGEPIWEPVELPAWSFSTPAVDNGIIFVGCENFDGGSIYAFDENTGEEIWNQSIGLIGKSSPVVGDTADGKVVYVVAREQELFALKGNDKIFAFEAETGKMLWNVTIGENTTAFGNIYKSNIYNGLGFNNIMATSSPASTPALHEDTLYVMALDGTLYALDITNKGKELWTFDATGGLWSITPSYNSASPVVVDDVVYVASENGHVFALDLTNEGEVIWDYSYEYKKETIPPPNYIFASPIVANGLVFVSANELDINDFEIKGKLYCIGDYSTNTKGKIISAPIHVQKGKWWNEFDAEIDSDGENNTITFSILDENGNEINGLTGLNGTKNSIKSVNSNVIMLCAELTVLNTTHPTLHSPILKSWEISWITEREKPVFVDGSFEPGEDGWINNDLSECSIEAYDVADDDLLSGLDTESAKFLLEYIPKDSSTATSTWFDAVCDGDQGITRTRIRAKISDLDIDPTKLINITFKIKDLAGNEETSNTITFKIDNTKPSSFISNTFEEKYNEEVVISVEAYDEGDEGQETSGVSIVTLKYRNSTDNEEWSEWKTYQAVSSPFSFTFLITGDMTSGYYEVTTIATDKANNNETDPFDSSKVSDPFLLDMIVPEMASLSGEHTSMEAPSFDLEISDDFELDSVYYRPHSEAEWTEIDSNIGGKTYSDTWSVPEDYWVDIDPNEGHYIFFNVTDICGNELITDEDNSPYIIKDENITDFYVDLSDFAEMQWDDKFTITATVPDDIEVESVTLFYRFSADSDDFTDVEWKEYGEKTSEPYEWEFVASDGNGYYEFYTKTTNTEGSSFSSPVESVKVSLLPTSSATLMIILALLLVIITVFVLIKMKKKKE